MAAWPLAPGGSIAGTTAARRVTAKTRIFQQKVVLREVRPPVWRRVLVPGEMDLAELHDVVLAAMGWTNSHRHEFEAEGTRTGYPTRTGIWTRSPTSRQ